MAFPPGCLDEPLVLYQAGLCVHNVSKHLNGILHLTDRDQRTCSKPGCVTMRTIHEFSAQLLSFSCDSKLGTLLDGQLVVNQLATAFEQDGLQRGVHAGDFEWSSLGGLIKGRMSGITNAGIHHQPLDPCEECYQPGVMTGRLCGEVVDTKVDELNGCKVVAVYKIRFEASEKAEGGKVEGTLEGMVICPCLVP